MNSLTSQVGHGESDQTVLTIHVYDDTLNTDAYIGSRREYRFVGKTIEAASAQAKRNYRRETGCRSRLRAIWFGGEA